MTKLLMIRYFALALGFAAAWRLGSSPAIAQEAPTRAKLFIMNVDGSEVRPFVSVDGMVWHGSPAWSADGERMAFDASPEAPGGPKSHVFTASLNEPKKTLANLGPGNAPAWSPDGKRLAFFQHNENPAGAKAGVWTMNADGTDRKWLSEGSQPRWSPDGRQLAFASDHEGKSSLYVIENGERRRVLFVDYNRVVGPAWSPDGKLLIYIAIRESQDPELKESELGVTSASGQQDTPRIRYRGEIGWLPSWSPDGRQIVLWTLDARGAKRLALLRYAGNDEPVEIKGQEGAAFNSDAAWSPDGKRLAFTSDR